MVGAQRASRPRVRALPMAEGAGGSACPYALGRRKADARPRPGPDVEGKAAADRRALTRPRAAHHAADLRQHPQGQGERDVSLDRRRERQPRRRSRGPRLPPRDRIVGAAGSGRRAAPGQGAAGELPRLSTQLVQAVWGGILFGSVYGLMALGLTLVWGAVRLLNLAHGAIFVVGSYVAYFFVSRLNLPILVALPIGVLAAAAFAYLMHLTFIRPVIGKPGFDNSTLIATVGISIAVSAAAILIFNPEYKVIPPVITGNFTVSDVQITKQGLLVIGTSLALFGLVYLFLTYTRQGMAIRAVSQQQEAASLMSIPVVRTYGMVIAISGALAGLAGVLLSPFFFLNPNSGFNPMIQALIVTIFGGLGSVRGALVAGFVLGIFESFVEVYYGVAWAQPGVFLLIILMLILRPNGLFGIGEVRRL